MSERRAEEHDRPPAKIGQTDCPGYYELMETAVRELLIDKGWFSADDIQQQIEMLGSCDPLLGVKATTRNTVIDELPVALSAHTFVKRKA